MTQVINNPYELPCIDASNLEGKKLKQVMLSMPQSSFSLPPEAKKQLAATALKLLDKAKHMTAPTNPVSTLANLKGEAKAYADTASTLISLSKGSKGIAALIVKPTLMQLLLLNTSDDWHVTKMQEPGVYQVTSSEHLKRFLNSPVTRKHGLVTQSPKQELSPAL